MKPVYFAEYEDDILKYSQTLPNFSKWVKHRLRVEKDIGDIESLVNKLIDARMGSSVITVSNNMAENYSQFM